VLSFFFHRGLVRGHQDPTDMLIIAQTGAHRREGGSLRSLAVRGRLRRHKTRRLTVIVSSRIVTIHVMLEADWS